MNFSTILVSVLLFRLGSDAIASVDPVKSSHANAYPAQPEIIIHEIRTPEGEVFRGQLIHADATRLVLRSKAAGELTFHPSDVICTPPPPILEPLPLAPAWIAVEPTPAAPPPAAMAPVAPPPPATPASPPPPVASITPVASPSRWRRSLEGGYGRQTSVVTKVDVYVRAETTYRADNHYDYRALVKYLYGEQDGLENTDRLEGLLSVRHDFARRWLFRGDLNYRNDLIRDLDVEGSGFVGVAYLLFSHPRFRLLLGPGVGARYRESDSGLLEGTRFNTDFVEDATWTITERINLTQGASFIYDAAQPEAYRVRTQAALGAKLTDHLRAHLRYEYEFDRARPPGAARFDQRVFTTLGVEF